MKTTPKRGLGRGFDALIPQNFDNSLLLNEDERVQKLPIINIHPNKTQPRTIFDDSALNDLAASIKLHGILQPIVVTPTKTGAYQIIAGERRWRAAQIARLKTIPAIVRSLKELEQLELALVENVQRVDLSPLEQAASIQQLRDQFNVSTEIIAKRLGKAHTTVHNIVRLLNLPIEAQDALRKRDITEGHARAILALKDTPDAQAKLLELIQKHHWSVRQAEQFVTTHKSGIHDARKVTKQIESETPATKKLSKLIAAPVSIHRTAKGGKLEIGFKSEDQLEKLVSLLSSLLDT